MKRKNMAVCMVAIALGAAGGAAEAPNDGGNLKIWPEGHGTFIFVNAQSAIGEDMLAAPVEQIANDFGIDVRIQRGEAVEVRAVPAALDNMKAKGAIWVVNDPAMPVVLAACESGWGILNVAPMLADSPDGNRLRGRVTRMVNRLFGFVHGAYESGMMPQCVMKQAHGMDGLDALVCQMYSPEAFSKISSYLAGSGYKQCRMGSYRDACEEGWAPPPTNAVQKAIWNKVHQLPSQPIPLKKHKGS